MSNYFIITNFYLFINYKKDYYTTKLPGKSSGISKYSDGNRSE